MSKLRHQVLRGLPVVALVRGALPAPGHAQFSQQGPKLVGNAASSGRVSQGWSVSLSGDGNTVIVGGPYDNDDFGATWVFTRLGGVWGQQAKLVGTGAVTPPQQGWSVSLSDDGDTAIVGGPSDDTRATGGEIGAAWVFARVSGVWGQQGSKLVGTGAAGPFLPYQGLSVALSGDGNTAIIGAPYDGDLQGTAWVFTRLGGVWTQQAKLVGTGEIGSQAQQGFSVSLSGDGNTAIVGGPYDDNSSGATWVFTRLGGVWSQQAKLVGTGASDPFPSMQGFSVSLSGDGNTAIVGGPSIPVNGSGEVGAAWVFTSSGGVWSQQTKLVGTGANGLASQGSSVSLSGDGNTAIVGGPYDDNNSGAAWVFTRSGDVWSQKVKLVGTGTTGSVPAGEGWSVSLSRDATTAVVGGPGDNNEVGAAWVFTQPVFAGTPGKANCHGQSVSVLARQYGGLNGAAAALGYSDVSALQNAIMAFCED